MREIAKTGLMMASHAENNDLITYNIAKMRAEGHTKPLDHCKSRPPITEYSTCLLYTSGQFRLLNR